MEATFFVASRTEALGVRHADDLPVEPATEPIRVAGLEGLVALARAVGVEPSASMVPLRDATCQSFPVWEWPAEFTAKLLAASDDDLDGAASHWHDELVKGETDAEAWELCGRLTDLRSALSEGAADQRLFVLLEEKAI